MFALDKPGREALVAAASALEVGSTGLLTLDYFMGNRTPYRDPKLRGAIIGLSLGHDRAALYRSAVEGQERRWTQGAGDPAGTETKAEDPTDPRDEGPGTGEHIDLD